MNEIINEIDDVDYQKIRVENTLKASLKEVIDDGKGSKWIDDLTFVKTKKTVKLVPSVLNCTLIFLNDPNINHIRYNVLSRLIEFDEKKIKWPRYKGQCWDDRDDSCLSIYIEQTYFGVQFSRDHEKKAMSALLNKNSFNPLRNRLDKLPEWDKVERAEKVFIDYFGVKDIPINKVMSRKWLAGCIKRAYHPGCKFDNMLVIAGQQGTRKSTNLAKLAIDSKFFTDQVSVSLFTKHKDYIEAIQGKWIAELSEMIGMRKTDKDAIKLALSAQTDRCRFAYTKNVEEVKRMTCFIGTINDSTILSDETGNRRFWTLATDETLTAHNSKALSKDYVVQLWAEVKERFHDEQLWLNVDEAEMLEKTQEDFEVDDPLKNEIEAFLQQKVPQNWYEKTTKERINWFEKHNEKFNSIDTEKTFIHRKYITIHEIWHEMMQHQLHEICSPQVSRSITKALRKLFNKRRTKIRTVYCNDRGILIEQ